MMMQYPPHSSELTTMPIFMATLDSWIDNAGSNASLAILILSLRRSDRIQSLMSADYARQARYALLDRIQAVLREKDKILFVSDDECWILLPQLSSEALAILAVHRILGELSRPLKVQTHTIFFNPSLGIACAPLHGKIALSLLRAADAAQKEAQRDNQKFLMAKADLDHTQLPANLHSALEDVLDANSLYMLFQPKIDLRSRKVVSIEALVRWPIDHPLKIATNVLIDTAEACGLIELLTMRVLNKVLHDYVGWRRAGMDILVWVNLSARLLSLEQLPQMLMQALNIWGVPASSIGLEITESALIHDIEHTTDLLFKLKALGFHLSIDDFGTGYSSLAYLRRFPIDELKIDKLFVQGMTDSVQDTQIVKSIIDLAHNFNLPVVAEGVELASTLHQLEAMECDQIQGYLFARPMPAADLLGWCENFNRNPNI